MNGINNDRQLMALTVIHKCLGYNYERNISMIAVYANSIKQWCLKPLPDGKILDWSKLKQIADDIVKCI